MACLEFMLLLKLLALVAGGVLIGIGISVAYHPVTILVGSLLLGFALVVRVTVVSDSHGITINSVIVA